MSNVPNNLAGKNQNYILINSQQPEINLYGSEKITARPFASLPVDQIIQKIQSPPKAKQVRKLQQWEKDHNPETYKSAYFNFIAWCARWTDRREFDAVVSHTGIICIGIRTPSNQLASLDPFLNNDSFIHGKYYSPVDGMLILLFKTDCHHASDHEFCFRLISEYIQGNFGISEAEIDPNGKNVCQLYRLPNDPNAIVRLSSKIMKLVENRSVGNPLEVVIAKKSSTDDLDDWQIDKLTRLDPDQKKNDLLEILEAEEQSLIKNSAKEIVSRQPLFTWNDHAVIMPQTVNVIQGKYGQHKSRLSGNFVAAAVAKSNAPVNETGILCHQECLAFIADSERNTIEEFPQAIQSIKLNAGYLITDQIPNLKFTSLKKLDTRQRINGLKAFLHKVRQSTNLPVFVVLDVLTDCMSSFNDERQTLELFNLIGNLCEDYNSTFLLVMHENPSNNKARGHAGTEAANKASTVMQISTEQNDNGPDLIKIKFLKQRSSQRSDDIFLTFNQATSGLKLADEKLVKSHVNNQDQNEEQNLALTASHLEKILTDGQVIKGTVYDKLKGLLNRGDKTVRDRVKKIMDQAFLMEDKDGLPAVLAEKTGGKPEYFFLDVVPNR